METLTPTAAGDSSGANPSSVKSDDSSPRHDGGRGSPPPNCAICLGTCRNKSFTDSCLHQFCFKCLLTWSKVKAECPLCKQNFKSIIHNVRSNHQYDEYTVEQRVEETVQSIDIDTLASATRRFRYRTTLTLPRRESIAIQQLLMHYPLMADVFPSPPRRSPSSFRRTVYRHNLWARPLPDFTGRFRDCSPEFYRYNDSQMHRLVPWLNRELHYLLNENMGHISYVMTRILELLPQHHINSAEFREAIQRYFGDRTEHFLHELYCFASTPYDMQGYDRYVQYTTDMRVSTMINEVHSSSESEASVDSDIVMISHSEPAEPPPGPSRPPAPVYQFNYIPMPPPADNVIPIETISQSDSDDSGDEVMVVGYIKPPHERTPEVVDLLGSDSDVVVQDPEPPAPAAAAAAAPAPASAPAPPAPVGSPPAPLVKLCLKRTRARRGRSEDDEWVPSSEPMPPRRKRRPRPPERDRSWSSHSSSTTSDSGRSTPERRASADRVYHTPTSASACELPSSDTDFNDPPTSSELPSTDPDFSDPSSSSSYGKRKRLTKRRPKKKMKRSERVRGRRPTAKRARWSPENGRSLSKAESSSGRSLSKAESTSGRGSSKADSTSGRRSSKTEYRQGRSSSKAEPRQGRSSSKAEPRQGRSSSKAEPRQGRSSSKAEPRQGRSSSKAEPRQGRSSSKTESRRERSSKAESRDRSKKKSHSGKGVKSSKRNVAEPVPMPEPALTPPLPAPAVATAAPVAPELKAAAPAPGPSATAEPSERSRRRTAHETKRLRSVVNVMYKNPEETSTNLPASSVSIANTTNNTSHMKIEKEEFVSTSDSPAEARRDSGSDSEDDLPLNLTMRKMLFPTL